MTDKQAILAFRNAQLHSTGSENRPFQHLLISNSQPLRKNHQSLEYELAEKEMCNPILNDMVDIMDKESGACLRKKRDKVWQLHVMLRICQNKFLSGCRSNTESQSGETGHQAWVQY